MSAITVLIILCIIILVIGACIWKAVEISRLPVEERDDAIYGPHNHGD